MIFDNIKVYNFANAFHGMRNPLESWSKSDSFFGATIDPKGENSQVHDIALKWVNQRYPNWQTNTNMAVRYEAANSLSNYVKWLLQQNDKLCEAIDVSDYTSIGHAIYLGPNDLQLAQRLIKAGPEHRKFMRQIIVSVDITAPLYWWKEFDTYKVGIVANSTSTMHKLAATPITIDCFETDDYNSTIKPIKGLDCILDEYIQDELIYLLEQLRQKYLETKDKRYWKELIRWLPEGWLQTRTVTMNYENLLSICSSGQRRYHKLTEWSDSFISFARKLPYAQELIFLDETDDQSKT